jgi:hypothetical protein
MTLLDAKQFDEARERRRRRTITAAVLIVIVLALLAWRMRYWPEEHAAQKFFSALQQQQFENAYGLYFADPDWRQHPQKYSDKYSYADFYRDWGPGGEWGPIKQFKLNGSATCPHGSSGIVVDFVVNGRSEHAQVWVEKRDKALSMPPCDLQFQ